MKRNDMFSMMRFKIIDTLQNAKAWRSSTSNFSHQLADKCYEQATGMMYMLYHMACQYADGPEKELEKLIEQTEVQVPEAELFIANAKSLLQLYLAGAETNKIS